MERVVVILTREMIESAQALCESVTVHRTQASRIDTLTGILGEFAFAQYFYNDWQKHRVGANKGAADFPNVEIKASAYPFSPKLNLLVRADYARKRHPGFYIQVIINVRDPHAEQIPNDTRAYLCGFATAEEVEHAPQKDFGSKLGAQGGYICHYIPLTKLHSITKFRKAYQEFLTSSRSASSENAF